MRITRVVVWMLALAGLGGCASQYQGNEKSPFYVVPNGSTVTLNQELTYPPEVVGVYFQHGAIVHKALLDLYRPHCRLEINDLLPTQQVVNPDRFTVVRATQEILHSVQLPVMLAARGNLFAGRRVNDSPGPELYATRLNLRSANQPNVIRLTCGHLESPPVHARHLTIEEIRMALGGIFTLQLAASPSL